MLSCCSISKIGFMSIFQSGIENLRKLTIRKFNFTGEVLRNFVRNEWNMLTQLFLCNLLIELGECDMLSQNLKVLSKCKFKNLELFSLSFNDLSDDSIEYMSCSNWLLLNELYLCKKFVI